MKFMRQLVSALVVVMTITMLAATGASAHQAKTIEGTVDCQGNYSITGTADWWGEISLLITLNGSQVASLPGGDVTHDVRPFGPVTGTGAAPGDPVTARASDQETAVTGKLVLIGGPCEEPFTPRHKASFQCNGFVPTLSVALAGYREGSRIRVAIDGNLQYNNDSFAPDLSRVWASMNPRRPHTAQIVVDSTSETGDWTRNLHVPACVVLRPSGSINGPCEDPMYRATFDNRDSNQPVTFTFRWKAFSDSTWRNTTRTVAAGSRVKTGYKHVLEFSNMRIRALGQTLDTEVAAKGGWYGKCPK